jgi:hypothetical protein
MHSLLDNGWIQSILGGLICSGLLVVGKWLVARTSSYWEALFSMAVATIVFCFGNILQPTVQFSLEGNNSAYWVFWTLLRQVSPPYFVLGIVLGGVLPGIPTGLSILKGNSFKQRVAYGAFWAPISLTVVDMIVFYLIRCSILVGVADWETIYFSLFCDFTGGIAGGFIIGAVCDLYFKHLETLRSQIV